MVVAVLGEGRGRATMLVQLYAPAVAFDLVDPPLNKRFASPEEVASLVAYIASPRACLRPTGAAFRVDGGVVKSAF
jgi:NAD(P)-dependent dehydrogenase (short-subunit alcohol dehydrogenase family)